MKISSPLLGLALGTIIFALDPTPANAQTITCTPTEEKVFGPPVSYRFKPKGNYTLPAGGAITSVTYKVGPRVGGMDGAATTTSTIPLAVPNWTGATLTVVGGNTYWMEATLNYTVNGLAAPSVLSARVYLTITP